MHFIPLISCDDLFVSAKGLFTRRELRSEEVQDALKVLVLYCSGTRSIFAHTVPKKGLDPDSFVVKQIKQDVL